MDVVWQSRIEGIISGIAIFNVMRCLIYNRVSRSLVFIGISWMVLICLESLRSYMWTIPKLFIAYIPFSQTWLIFIRGAMIWGYLGRVNEQRAWLIGLLYLLFVSSSLTFTIALCIRVRCTFTGCTPPIPLATLTYTDLVSTMYYLTLMLILDVIFVAFFTKDLYRNFGGRKALTFRPYMYHIFLQTFITIFIAANFYRIMFVAFAGIKNIAEPLWLYPDTLLILSLLEYGVSRKDLLIRSTKSTTLPQIDGLSRKLAAIQLTKDNILKYLDHSVRNRLQQLMYHLQTTRQTLDSGEKHVISKQLTMLESMTMNIALIVNDVHIMDNMRDAIPLKPTVFDIVEVITAELVTLLELGSETYSKLENSLPSTCFVYADKERISQVLHLIYGLTMENRCRIEVRNDDHVLFILVVVEPEKFKVDKIKLNLHNLDDYHLVLFKILDKLCGAMNGHLTLTEVGLTFNIPLDIVTNIDMTAMWARDEFCLARGILVVDDDDINRRLLRKLITVSIGKDVEMVLDEAENGAEAVRKITERSETGQLYKLVFMDVMMPVMDGLEACRCIKEKWQDVVVILVTANEERSTVESAHDGFIQKPVAKREVQRILRTYNFLSPEQL